MLSKPNVFSDVEKNSHIILKYIKPYENKFNKAYGIEKYIN